MYDLALGTTRYGVGGISHAHGTTWYGVGGTNHAP